MFALMTLLAAGPIIAVLPIGAGTLVLFHFGNGAVLPPAGQQVAARQAAEETGAGSAPKVVAACKGE